MKPATRSASGAALVVGSGPGKAGSKASAAVPGRIQRQQVATEHVEPPSDRSFRSRAGPARDQQGKFVKGGTLVGVAVPAEVLVDPTQRNQKEAAAVLGSVVTSSAGKGKLVDDFEGCEDQSDGGGSISSSEASDCESEGGGLLGEQQGRCSNQIEFSGVQLAHQVFDDLPEPISGAGGASLGGDTSASIRGLAGGVTLGSSKSVGLVVEQQGLCGGVSSAPVLEFQGDVPLGGSKRDGAGLALGGAVAVTPHSSRVVPGAGPSLGVTRAETPLSIPAVPGAKLGGADPVSSLRRAVGADVGSSEPTVGGAQRAPWVSLFNDNRNLSKGIMLEEKVVDGDLVSLEEDDVDDVEEAWGFCLVGLFAGKFPGWTAVSKLKEGWRVNCTQWRHSSGWLVFKFQSDEDRIKVLNGGPYFAYGSNLMLKILPSCFRFEGVDISSVPIWIQLPGLPLDCWNARALSKIVSKVGKPITTDKMTRTKERLSFARVLVEVDVSSEVVSNVEIRLPTGVVYHQLVISEYTPKFCRSCKSFGHVEASCGKASMDGQHRPYVARKKGPLVAGGKAAPVASKSSVGPAATAVVGDRVCADAGRGALGDSYPVGDASVRPAVAWMPPWPVQPATRHSADVVGAADVLGKGVGASISKGKEVLVSENLPVGVDSRQGPVGTGINLVSHVQGESTLGRKGKKKKKKSGKGDVLHVLQQSGGEDPLLLPHPYDDFEDCLERGYIGGKKGGRKK